MADTDRGSFTRLLPKAAEMPKDQRCVVVCPPERYIHASFPEIYSIVKTSMSIGERQRYEEVCQLIESLYAQEFMTLRRNLKQNFLAFSTGAKSQDLVTRKGRGLPPKSELNVREEKLVADFLQLMAAARFQLTTRKEWDIAMSERFMFQLPVKVNWDFFDTKMLSSFWSSSPERAALRTQLPHMADRALIFHRGIGLAEDSGLFINQKIDLLVEYLVVWPLLKVWHAIVQLLARLFGRKRSAATSGSGPARAGSLGTAASGNLSYAGGQDSLAGGVSALLDGQYQDPGKVAAAAEQLDLADEELLAKQHRATKVVERRTLKRVLPTAWSVIKNIYKPLELQEPMYKEVVVMYRTSGQGRKPKQNKVPVKARSMQERLKDILERRNVHVKFFHDIPMADMEVIFPDKKIYLKNLSLITMVVQGAAAFFAAIAGLWQAGQLDLKAVWSAMSLVAARCGQLYSSMQAERSEMVQDMVNILYDKTNDAQEGVICMLMEDMAEQQLKEAVLAYTMLYMRLDDEVTQEDLDEECESFLFKNFNLNLDFAVEDALPNLVKWGVVKRTRNGRYQARSVEDAHNALAKQWMRAYEAISRPPVPKQLPLTALLPGGDRTPDVSPVEAAAAAVEAEERAAAEAKAAAEAAAASAAGGKVSSGGAAPVAPATPPATSKPASASPLEPASPAAKKKGVFGSLFSSSKEKKKSS